MFFAKFCSNIFKNIEIKIENWERSIVVRAILSKMFFFSPEIKIEPL